MQREKERMSEKYGIVMDKTGEDRVTKVTMTGLNERQRQMKDLQFEFYNKLN